MDGSVFRAIGMVVGGAFGVALLSVVFSQRSQASSVITSAGNAFSGILSAATAPVTGATPASATASNVTQGISTALGAIDNGSFGLG